MITLRVSQVDTYRAWCEEEDSDLGWLLNALTSKEETEPMRKGTAFHKCLELAREGTVDVLESDGYTFYFRGDFQVELPLLRERRAAKDYGGILVSGRADGLNRFTLVDYKSTASLDAERYIHGYQWRYYLDIHGADRFVWQIFEMEEIGRQVYEVYAQHQLEQWRYPALEADCRELALDLKEFLSRHLPDWKGWQGNEGHQQGHPAGLSGQGR